MKIIKPVTVNNTGSLMRNSPGTYWDSTGVLRNAAANALRVTYDPSNLSNPPYALLEQSSANIIPSPGNINGAAWAASGGASTYDFSGYPDPMGTNRAVRWTASPSTGRYIRINGLNGMPNMINGQKYTASVFMRPVSGTTGTIEFGIETPINKCFFNVADWTTSTTGGNATPRVDKCADGWYRISVSFIGDTTGNKTLLLYGWTGTPTIDVFGDMIELGDLTSYIDANTTRAADTVVGALPAATNLATDSQGFVSGWGGTPSVAATATVFPDITGSLPYKKIAKTTTASSEGKSSSIGSISAGSTVYATIALRASTASGVSFGLFDGSGWGTFADSTATILAGPGYVTQLSGGLFSVIGLTSTDDTVVQVARTYVSAGVGQIFIYAGTSASTTNGDSILATRCMARTDAGLDYIATTTTAVTRPATVQTGAMLISSNVAESDYPVWSASTLYKSGDFIMDLTSHKIYQSIIGASGTATFINAGTGTVTMTSNGATYVPAVGTPVTFSPASGATMPTGLTAGTVYYVIATTATSFSISATVGGTAIAPSTTGSGTINATASSNINKPVPNTTYWLDCGMDNRWDMFDTSITSQTTNDSEIIIAIVPGSSRIDSIVGMNCAASKASVAFTDMTSRSVVYSANVNLVSSSGVQSWYDYFYKPIVQLPEFVVSGIPLGMSTTSLVLVRISIPSGSAKCGGLVLGLGEEIGYTEWGAKVGTIDYSLKTQDSFGNYQITPRVFSKKGDFTVKVPTGNVDYLQNMLAQYRATPIVYLGANSGKTQFNSTLIYGFYKDFEISIDYDSYSACQLTIEGLT